MFLSIFITHTCQSPVLAPKGRHNSSAPKQLGAK